MNDSFKLERVPGTPVSDDELIEDLKRVSDSQGITAVTQKAYEEHGKYNPSTIIRRFDTWNKALSKAGLTLSNELSLSDEKLFENILTLWQHYGRQPRRAELAKPPSTISQSPYNRRFSTWTSALQEFVNYANQADIDSVESSTTPSKEKRKTGRDPSIRLRYKVLQRDSFKCCSCGSSPATNQEVVLHVDHVTPWSKGGDTTLENLQTLCSTCNLGKSNAL